MIEALVSVAKLNTYREPRWGYFVVARLVFYTLLYQLIDEVLVEVESCGL